MWLSAGSHYVQACYRSEGAAHTQTHLSYIPLPPLRQFCAHPFLVRAQFLGLQTVPILAQIDEVRNERRERYHLGGREYVLGRAKIFVFQTTSICPPRKRVRHGRRNSMQESRHIGGKENRVGDRQEAGRRRSKEMKKMANNEGQSHC